MKRMRSLYPPLSNDFKWVPYKYNLQCVNIFGHFYSIISLTRLIFRSTIIDIPFTFQFNALLLLKVKKAMSQSQQFLRAQNDLKKMGTYVSKKSNGQTQIKILAH